MVVARRILEVVPNTLLLEISPRLPIIAVYPMCWFLMLDAGDIPPRMCARMWRHGQTCCRSPTSAPRLLHALDWGSLLGKSDRDVCLLPTYIQ